MITITKSFEFAYAHFLPGYDGPCKNIHGHTGILEVEVSGQPIKSMVKKVYPTMVMDFGDLKKIVENKILSRLDHQFLNDLYETDQAPFKYPTAEKMAEWVAEELKEDFEDNLIRVRIYETPTSYAEWRKE